MEDPFRIREFFISVYGCRRFFTLFVLLWAGLGAPAGARPTSSSDIVAIQTAIEMGNRSYVAALEASDAHRFASIFIDDALSLPPSGSPIRGRAEIEASMVSVFSRVRFTDGSMHSVETRIMGDTVVEIGTYRLAIRVDGYPSVLSGRYLTIWRRVDGVWKIAVDSSQPSATGDTGGSISPSPAALPGTGVRS